MLRRREYLDNQLSSPTETERGKGYQTEEKEVPESILEEIGLAYLQLSLKTAPVLSTVPFKTTRRFVAVSRSFFEN